MEVLFLYSPIDDFVMNNLREFGGRKLVTAESAEVSPGSLRGGDGAGEAAAAGDSKPEAGAPPKADAAEDAAGAPPALTEAKVTALGDWLVKTLPHKLSKVRE